MFSCDGSGRDAVVDCEIVLRSSIFHSAIERLSPNPEKPLNCDVRMQEGE